REPELRRARKWMMSEFKATTWADIKSRYLSNVDEDRWFRMTTSYWEMLATIVNRGALHAELFFDHTGEDIVTWDRVKGLVPDARSGAGGQSPTARNGAGRHSPSARSGAGEHSPSARSGAGEHSPSARSARGVHNVSSTFGRLFRVTTFGESHGPAVGVLVD